MKMVFKFFVFVSILTTIVYAQEEDWSCETVNGTLCSGKAVMIQGGNQRYPYINGSLALTCSDTKKEKSNTVFSYTTYLSNGDITTIGQCQRLKSPCITDFEVCIKDPNVPTVTLKCRYLKDFDQIQNGNASPGSQNNCGAKAAKQHMYLMYSGNGTTTITYNSGEISIWKPVNRTFNFTFIPSACSPLPKPCFLFLILIYFFMMNINMK